MTRWLLSSSSDHRALDIVDGVGPFAEYGPHCALTSAAPARKFAAHSNPGVPVSLRERLKYLVRGLTYALDPPPPGGGARAPLGGDNGGGTWTRP